MRKLPLVCLALFVFSACGSARTQSGPERGQPVASTPQTTPCDSEGSGTSGDNNFAVPTYREGHSLVMSLVFPDGSVAEMLLPTDVGVESFLPTGRVWMDLRSGADAGRNLALTYGSAADSLKEGDHPIECYDGVQGQVEVWRSGWEDLPHWIFFPVGSWTARVGTATSSAS